MSDETIAEGQPEQPPVTDDPATSERRAPTAPQNIPVSLRGFDTEDHARSFADIIAEYARELSRYIDLERLDGITVAYDYDQALLELDRGYEASIQLTASKDRVIGVAMSPGVMRDGVYKRHLVFNAPYVMALEDAQHELFGLSFHTMAHECAHVEVATAYDRAFPGVLLQQQHGGMLDAMRSDVIFACWDEYATCWIVAGMGEDPLPGYQQTLLEFIGDTRSRANGFIRAYRLHADVGQLLREVCGVYGDLLKFASYFAGTMVGQDKTLADVPEVKAAIEGSWFEPYFDRLLEVMAGLTGRWGEWQSEEEFQAIADIFIDMVEDGGVEMTAMENGGVYANVPFTLGTL